ncbi:response regulator [Desulfovibrio sp. OttesenSCG-928-A18]|nr:response regulator [Desulfovibrio sp. OttesenSCG-928-A18]
MNANTLLIIEDSPIQAKIISQRFESLTGFGLLVAHSLAEARALAEANRQDIFAAVADLNLPDAPDGETVDLCRGMDIPCVVLAASFDENVRRGFLDKQVADYFLKGSIDDLDPLVASVQRLHANFNVKALVVDDSSTQRAVVKRMLAVQCISSIGAEDGLAALEVLRSTPEIRLVITDFNMPRMDGITLVQEIRNSYKITKLAVIGLSSTGSGALTARFLKNGANDFLTKPFEAEEFYWRVNQTLNILDTMQELHKLRKQG